MKYLLALSPLIQALSELMERSVSQLLSVRREHNSTKLDVDELKELWVITMSFVQVRSIRSSHLWKITSTFTTLFNASCLAANR